jgi:myo-inositol-1(or 4)-monophosphatase
MGDLHDLRRIAALATRAGGEIVRAGAGGPSAGVPAEEKGAGDYVTAVDRASEAAIRELLAAATPDIPVVGEEGGGSSAGGRYWLVDPLDGTTNFVHRFPVVGVSVALIEDGRPVAGAVDAPFLGQTWAAARGGGAASVGDGTGTPEPLHVASREPARSVVGTGFPFRRRELLPRYLEVMRGAFGRFEDLRRPGAAALDLVWVAAGVFDGFFELALAPWDVAAGGLLIEEAGGVVTDWTGGGGWLAGDILAGSPAVHADLVDLAGGPA